MGHKTLKDGVESYDSPHRRLHLNQEKGLAYCMLMTTLYDENDSSCKKCKVKKECQIVLKAQYPVLWENRVKNRNGKTTK